MSSQCSIGTVPIVVSEGGTGIATTTAYGLISGGTTSTGSFQNAGTGTSTQYLVSNGSAALPSFQSVTGGIVQKVRTFSNSAFSTTASIPIDNTIPQNTEGDSLITLAITPKSASNVLIFDFSCYISLSNGGQAALFSLIEGVTANAVYATANNISAGSQLETISWKFYKTAPATSAVTYAVRWGVSGNTAYANSLTGTQLFGGVEAIVFTITEVFP